MTSDEMPEVIWVHYTQDFVSDYNVDEECVKYTRADNLETVRGQVKFSINKLGTLDSILDKLQLKLESINRCNSLCSKNMDLPTLKYQRRIINEALALLGGE